MKICLINHSFPPQIGGGETQMYLLAKGFSERKHDVTVITDGSDALLKEHRYNFSILRIEGFRTFEKGTSSFRHILDDLAKALFRKTFDVIHVHNFMPGLAYASIFSTIKTKKTVFTFHSTPIPEEKKIIGFFANFSIEKAFTSFIIKLPFYDTLVCPSRYYYDWALKLGAKKKKIRLIYHGIDEKSLVPTKIDPMWKKKYGYSNDDFIIVCPARMIYRKGILDIIRAVQILDDEKIKLLIPTSVQNGSTEYLKLVNDYIQKNNLLKKVKLVLDEETLETMPQIFANCSVCVLPSHVEGLGIVLLEGMAAGIPVIGSDTFGINEIINDGINGLLSRPKNPKNLAEKILLIRNNPKLSAILVEGGKKSIHSKFSLNKQLKSLELVYQ